ncbi:hypothetical protein CC1G_03853 [Coprinopsis cinerea okayama7|uniref:PIN domain-containing protein n=1 Tax=Coprinopsis cinerea (strain Okayama-7 / 130 / ATCC MYA-4618 / FGSC 9003) TaxID=240176 RepID=A8NGZ3_COPC7|nr:hypothetical protein CC1G_03853 [Coprinopsis cinerea okayama7\|eukprot:XP_001833636.2 hypothetical protein CC1G_03853 [Coprinopsis cinerea okayama7\
MAPPLQETIAEQPMRSSRKGKEREPGYRDLASTGPQVTDLDEKLLALRRRTAGAQRIRDRADRERGQTSQASPATNSNAAPNTSTPSRTERSPRLSTQTASKQAPNSPRRHASPQVIVTRQAQEADHEEFSRKLHISSSRPSPRQAHAQANKQGGAYKLYNPDTDRIPTRRIPEPEAHSDTTGSSHVPAPRQREDRGGGSRQLFDYRKDDPVRFSVLARPQTTSTPSSRATPTVKPSGDYISASSTSSNNASQTSSVFTLSSTTDGSSASSNLFDGRPKEEDSGNNIFGKQLKRLYRNITELESRIQQEDANDDEEMGRGVLLKGKEPMAADAEKEKWKKQIADHKELAETIHNLLEISLSPSVPASLRTIPTKYNIIVRLWTYAFHKILESLRRASFQSPVALEHLQDFIYYAYTFYTGLLEEPNLTAFKSSWLEALGDLARYRMAVAAMVNSGMGGQGGLTTKAVNEAAADSGSLTVPDADAKSISDAPAARIDDSPSPSVGIAAARSMEIEPEKERWRNIAREWYGAGLAEQPGTGKLHHHLGLLSREVEAEELRGIYHFTKSMTTLHPFSTSRENVLPIWSLAAQARRSLPDARASELFVLLHGMLFTNIQLDDFQPSLARFIERLTIEGAEEKEWIMMAVVNIASILEYGRPSSLLRKLGVVGPKDASGAQAAAMRVMAKKAAAGVPGAVAPEQDDKMEIDGEDKLTKSPILLMNGPDGLEQPAGLSYALQLTFAMLTHVLRRPHRQASQFSRPTLNPYLTVILTFLATILKHPAALEVLERSIPWQDLANFFTTIPRRVMSAQGLFHTSKPTSGDRWPMLTSGVAPPLPEDWCMRGMEWVGRRVFERGYWKSGEDRKAELEVLEQNEGKDMTDGRIEDDDEDESGSKKATTMSELERRWTRVCRSAISIANTVDGLTWLEGTRDWKVEGKLAQKVERWREEDRVQRLEEEKRRMGKRWVDDAMDVDESGEEISEESDEDDENDSEEIKALKARRRYLESLLKSAKNNAVSSPPRPRTRLPRRAGDHRPQLNIVPGYSVLVVDTNILLSSLSMVSSLIESMKWTVVIPLPVVMELDGLAANTSTQLAEAASSALNYITSHIRSHSLSLKVQTSKGNYLTSLNVRTEEVDFSGGVANNERSMDDLILKAAIWQDEHWVDRSSMLKAEVPSPESLKTAEKVVFLSLDRNLRLKARSRQVSAAGEKDLALLLSTAK